MNSFPLGRTQRDIIRDHNEFENANTERTIADDVDATDINDVEFKTRDKRDEKRRFCLPKCILLMVGLLILLGGMIALIYLYKAGTPDPRGEVQPNKEPKEECPKELYVSLGEPIVIHCTMNNDIPGDVDAVYANLLGASTEDFNCTKDDRNVTCTSKVEAKCSTYGEVHVQFYDGIGDDKTVTFTEVVRIKVSVIFPTTSITQEFKNESSEFHLQCSYSGACTSYEVGFYGRNKNLADSVSCTTSYSDSEGYNVNCKASVSSQVIYDLGNGTKLYCYLMQGSVIKMEKKELQLPFCNDIQAYNENCNASTTTLFDCRSTLAVTENCDKTCELAEQCFPFRLHEIRNSDAVRCGKKCKLEWCREMDSLEIDDTETISFNHLCDKT